MYTLGIEMFPLRQLEQRLEHAATGLGGTGLPGYTKAIAPAGDLDAQALLDLLEVFVKLTAEVGKAVIVGGLEDYVPADLDGVQGLEITPLPDCLQHGP